MTRIFKWPADQPLPDDFLVGVKQLLDSGDIIVYPTNTLYGLGASIFSDRGIALLNAVKNRPAGMPISVMANESQIRKICHIPKIASGFFETAETRITAVLPALGNAPEGLVHRGTLAVRFPCDLLTASLVGSAGPITATSANRHGTPTPADVEGAIDHFGDRILVYIDSGILAGKPTTLVDYTGERPKIIREGAFPAAEIGDI